jgi:two-component system, OmpR family, response regulator
VTQKHVLVVDDDPNILELLARALASATIRVSTARRVSLARDVLNRQAVDLIVTDVRIPGETGLALAETARQLGIATVLMSGDPEWAAEHDMVPAQYLAKPFELSELLRVVEARLRHGSRTVAPELADELPQTGRGRPIS